jgi:methylthioribulose-1-phosphate dehydratase
MLKGLGIWEQDPDVSLAVFPNHLHVPRIAEELAARFAAAPPEAPGFLIRDHGLTAWGPDADATLSHVEILVYLFGYISATRAAQLGSWT